MSCRDEENGEKLLTSIVQQTNNEAHISKSNQNINIPKTPVSLLQELYVRQGITPKYDLVQIEGAVHEPTFKYRVTVGEAVATGCGASKKKAKHEAAKNILTKLKAAQKYVNTSSTDILSQSGNVDNPQKPNPAVQGPSTTSAVVSVQLPNLETDLMSPYDDGISGNPVGELQEICMNRRMQPPVYEVSLEEGLPHERNFVINCLVGSKFRESGCGKSKKLAKRKAAAKMLATLKAQPIIVDDSDHIGGFGGIGGKSLPIDEDELAQGIAQRNAMLKGQKNKDKGGLYSVSNLLQHLKITNKNGCRLKSLQDPSLDLFAADSSVKDFEEYLEEIGEEQEFTITYVDVEEKSKSDKFHCFVQLATNPVAVCFGIGEDSEADARIDAARNAIEYLRIMTK